MTHTKQLAILAENLEEDESRDWNGEEEPLFLELPPEVLRSIGQYLDRHELLSLVQVNSYVQRVLSPLVWTTVVIGKFDRDTPNNNGLSRRSRRLVWDATLANKFCSKKPDHKVLTKLSSELINGNLSGVGDNIRRLAVEYVLQHGHSRERYHTMLRTLVGVVGPEVFKTLRIFELHMVDLSSRTYTEAGGEASTILSQYETANSIELHVHFKLSSTVQNPLKDLFKDFFVFSQIRSLSLTYNKVNAASDLHRLFKNPLPQSLERLDFRVQDASDHLISPEDLKVFFQDCQNLQVLRLEMAVDTCDFVDWIPLSVVDLTLWNSQDLSYLNHLRSLTIIEKQIEASIFWVPHIQLHSPVELPKFRSRVTLLRFEWCSLEELSKLKLPTVEALVIDGMLGVADEKFLYDLNWSHFPKLRYLVLGNVLVSSLDKSKVPARLRLFAVPLLSKATNDNLTVLSVLDTEICLYNNVSKVG